MDRYGDLTARTYDALSGEPVYGVGRHLALTALDLQPGERVLDVGCGTGLNLPWLLRGVGPEGLVVGLDRSPAMLDRVRTKAAGHHLPPLRLVRGDVRDPDVLSPHAVADGLPDPPEFDVVLATYSLSLVADVEAAWATILRVLAPAGRVAVVDMARPTGRWGWTSPLARAACALGGADIEAHPWRLLERDLRVTRSWSRWGGHVQVRVGTR